MCHRSFHEAAIALENSRLIEEIEEQRKELKLKNLQLLEANRKLSAKVEKQDTAIRKLEDELKIRPPKW